MVARLSDLIKAGSCCLVLGSFGRPLICDTILPMAKYYPRSFALAEGRKLVHRDMDGQAQQDAPPGQPAEGMSQFGPAWGMQKPFRNYMRFPPMAGGYDHPMTYQTMMGGQSAPQTYRTMGNAFAHPSGMQSGGEVDSAALAHACKLLHEAKLACGAVRASGGQVKRPRRDPRSPTELLHLLKASGANISPDRQFSYACERSPQIRYWFRRALKAGCNRKQAQQAIHHCLAELINQ